MKLVTLYVAGLGGSIYAIKDATLFDPTEFVYLSLMTVKQGGTTTFPPDADPNDGDTSGNDTPDNDIPATETPVVEPTYSTDTNT